MKNEKLLFWNNAKDSKKKLGAYLYPCLFKQYIKSGTIKALFKY